MVKDNICWAIYGIDPDSVKVVKINRHDIREIEDSFVKDDSIDKPDKPFFFNSYSCNNAGKPKCCILKSESKKLGLHFKEPTECDIARYKLFLYSGIKKKYSYDYELAKSKLDCLNLKIKTIEESLSPNKEWIIYGIADDAKAVQFYRKDIVQVENIPGCQAIGEEAGKSDSIIYFYLPEDMNNGVKPEYMHVCYSSLKGIFKNKPTEYDLDMYRMHLARRSIDTDNGMKAEIESRISEAKEYIKILDERLKAQ